MKNIKLYYIFVVLYLLLSLAGCKEETPIYGTVIVVNNSSKVIVNIYIKASSDSSWGDTEITHLNLNPGSTLNLLRIPIGTSDLKAVAQDATTWTKFSFPVSKDQSYTINLN